MNLSKNTKLIKVKAGAASGTTALTSDTVDTQGYEGVMFFGSVATADATNYAKARQGDDSGMSDGADLEGSKVAPGDNGDSFLIDIYRPEKRYVDVVITRTVATITGDVYALLYEPRKAPTSQGATIDAELHVSPAEGTA